jgi:MFS family permease
MKYIHPLRPWMIWGLAAFFFFAHYVVRVTPGQIIEELHLAFVSTTKLDIGILGAAFYLPYVLMQMPVGILVDKFGPRILLTFAVFLCGFSAYIFANATHFDTTIISRALLGFCSATAFIGALKLITNWFDTSKLALLVGITQALGMMGASFGSGIVPIINDSLGWRQTFTVYAWVFFVLSALIFIVIRNKPKDKLNGVPKNTTTYKSSIKSVLKNKQTWLNALYAGLIYAPSDAMGELWGKEFIQNIHGLDSRFASTIISFLFIGWAIGGPLAGALADKVGRRPVMLGSALCGLITLPILFYVPNLSAFWLMFIMFIYGLTNTGLIACYAIAGELHDKSNAGLSLGITNMLSVMLGAMLMPLIGALLEWHHSLSGLENLSYSAFEYQKATLLLPMCLLGAFIVAYNIKETMPKNARK